MGDIVFVSAALYLANKPNWKSKVLRPGFSPIPSNELYNFEQTLKSNSQEPVSSTAVSKAPEKSASDMEDGSKLIDYKGPKYQELRLFLPISLTQQLHTLVIQNVPESATKTADFIQWLERATTKHFSTKAEGTKVEDLVENWSSIIASTLESTQDIFIRMYPLAEFAQVVLYWIQWFSKATESVTTVHIDENTARYVHDIAPPDYTPDVSEEELGSLRSQIADLKSTNSESSTENAAMVAYDVDMSTLSDLPKSSLNQLVKDIIEFRTRVLTMEKEKRMQEALEEGRRRRSQLKRVMEQIRKSKGSSVPATEPEEDEDEYEDEDGEDDWAIERRRLEKEKESAQQSYNALLSHLNGTVMPDLRARKQRLTLLKDYEAKLLRERAFSLKELLHLGNSDYYDHRREFKEEEELQDDADRRAHNEQPPQAPKDAPSQTSTSESRSPDTSALHSTPTHEPVAKEQKIKLALKRVFDTRAQEAESDSEAETDIPATAVSASMPAPTAGLPDLLPFQGSELAARIAELRQSRLVDELVNEYLGVYEDELVDYILDNIVEHASRAKLLVELQETFDDDSVRIVDAIWTKLLKH
ncbi:AaceriAGR020Cp [[Ashbya] aceris (nom. inval.)]|nr:AaceriAGR020Cp [[Ashbya] aceris (nom. inval.)]